MTAALVPLVSALALSLVALAAATPGFRHVPPIPAGRRAEYYLQKASGSGYLFGYDTGDAAAHSHAAEADGGNEVRGRYQYTDAASGRRLGVAYTAGRRGFRPTSLDLAAGSAASGAATAGAAAAVATPRIDAGAPAETAAAAADADYDANADASYSFSIDTDSYKRTEAADRRGNVRGRYSYSSPAGGSHGLSYVAGEGTGFVVTSGAAESDEAAAAVSVSAATPESPPAAASASTGGVGSGGYSFSYSAEDHSRQEAGDAAGRVRGSYSFRPKGDAATRRVDYEAGAGTGFVARGSHLPVAPTPGYSVPLVAYSATAAPTPYRGPPADIQSTSHPDGSYSFSFTTDEQSRQETADAKNNVRGSYSFRSKDDGVTRKVEYSAGAGIGFVASGEHLPVAPPVPAVSPAVVSAYSSTGAEAAGAAEEETPGDASYEFSYDAGTHSRQESSDAAGNVRGRYSFVAGDGVARHVDYEAGAKKGFVAKGAHLPVPTSADTTATAYCASCAPTAVSGAGGYSFSYSTGDQSRDEHGDAGGNVRESYSFTAKDDGKARHVDYSAGAATGFLAHGAHLPSVASASSAGSEAAAGYSAHGSSSDGSYSFSYDAGDHSRQESADAHNNVRGRYSFVAKDDGKSRTVEYEAGAATGFVARGSHLPASGAESQAYSGAEEVAAPTAAAYSAQSSSGAGGYSFSYSTPDQSREETGDAHNNVRGRYSFVAKDDGQRRSVEYEAGAGKGFVARGAHLPQPPVPVPGAGLPVPAAPEVADARASASGAEDGVDDAAGDASYSYSYETDSHSKTETADARGNVRGSYSYRTPGGATRTLRYRARGAEGFVVTGVEDSGTAAAAADVTAAAAAAPGAAVSAHAQTDAAAEALAQSPVSRIVAGAGAGPRFVVRKYLPPESAHKFGYILDTQQRR